MSSTIADTISQPVPTSAQVVGVGENGNNDILSQLGHLNTNVTGLQEQVEALQSQVDSQQLLIWALAALLALLIIGLVVTMRKINKSQSIVDRSQDKKLQELERRLNERVHDATSDVKSLKNKLDDLETATNVAKETYFESRSGYKGNQAEQTSNHQESDNRTTSKPESNLKYFIPQEMNGQLIVKDRNLKAENSRSWFIMNISGNTATYDINPLAQSSMLSDIMTLSMCVNGFEPKPNARSIRTLSKGSMRKHGDSWIVTEKLTIELV